MGLSKGVCNRHGWDIGEDTDGRGFVPSPPHQCCFPVSPLKGALCPSVLPVHLCARVPT